MMRSISSSSAGSGSRKSKPRAASLADELQEQFEVPTRLIKGGQGDFEVKLGDEVLFSKRESGRFPEPGEVPESLAPRLDSTGS